MLLFPCVAYDVVKRGPTYAHFIHSQLFQFLKCVPRIISPFTEQLWCISALTHVHCFI
jgi:hypothetical protein